MTLNFIKADSRNIPKVENVCILEYIASNPNHNLIEIRGAKMLLSSRESYLDTAVGYVQIARTAKDCTVKARVVPEHRVNNKPYTTICVIDESNGVIISATCDGEQCPVSAGGCKHSLVLLFWLEKKSSQPPSTSVECYWNKPTLSTARTELCTSKQIFPTAKQPNLAPKDSSILSEFYEECNRRQITDSLIVTFATTIPKEKSMNIFDLTISFVERYTSHDFENFKEYLFEIIDDGVIQSVNEKTMDQNECKYWHNIRQGRLTASKLHEAANCKTDGSLVQQLLGGYKVPETKHMQRGKKLENEVLQEIRHKLNVQINKSGFVLINGILGASPDGVAQDFVVEIKCPSSRKAVQTYLKNKKVTTKFKTQIQCQMLACNKDKGLFCVADPLFESNKKIHMVWEDFDAHFIDNVIKRAEKFWKTYVYAKLLKSALSE